MTQKSDLSTQARKLLRKLISDGGKQGLAISRRNLDAAKELESLRLGFWTEDKKLKATNLATDPSKFL